MTARSRLSIVILAGLSLGMVSGGAVEVPLDVDVYDQPADESTKRSQFLKGKSQVILLHQNADHWCNVAPGKDPIPGGTGWIWCGKGDDGQDYSVRKVTADKPDMQVIEAKCPAGMEIEVNGPPLICREKLADGTTKCTEVTVADNKLVLNQIGQCPAM